MCRNWLAGGSGPPVTLSYRPDRMSTLQPIPDAPSATKLFNFEDLPCPPSNIADQLEPGKQYNPIIVPPFNFSTLLHVKRQVSNKHIIPQRCLITAIRDPPTRAIRVHEILEMKEDSERIF